MDCLATEQDFSNEVDEMLACWTKDNNDKIPEPSQDTIVQDMSKRDHYDGVTSAIDLKKSMTTLTDTKVYMRQVRENPDGKQITSANTVIYDIISYVVGQSKPFENSISTGKPVKVSLEEGPIIPGLLIALLNLREAEHAYILVHPAHGFGNLGCPPLIPPDAYLYFYIKVLKVLEESTLTRVIDYERHYLTEIPLSEKVTMIDEHKKIANDFWKDGQHREALVRYKDAIKVLEELDQNVIMSNKDLRVMMTDLLLNSTIVLNKLGNHKSATKYAKRALKFDPENVKIYYHLAKARIGLADYLTALCWIERAQKIDPKNRCFDALKLQIEPYYRNYDENELLRKMANCSL